MLCKARISHLGKQVLVYFQTIADLKSFQTRFRLEIKQRLAASSGRCAVSVLGPQAPYLEIQIRQCQKHSQAKLQGVRQWLKFLNWQKLFQGYINARTIYPRFSVRSGIKKKN